MLRTGTDASVTLPRPHMDSGVLQKRHTKMHFTQRSLHVRARLANPLGPPTNRKPTSERECSTPKKALATRVEQEDPSRPRRSHIPRVRVGSKGREKRSVDGRRGRPERRRRRYTHSGLLRCRRCSAAGEIDYAQRASRGRRVLKLAPSPFLRDECYPHHPWLRFSPIARAIIQLYNNSSQLQVQLPRHE